MMCGRMSGMDVRRMRDQSRRAPTHDRGGANPTQRAQFDIPQQFAVAQSTDPRSESDSMTGHDPRKTVPAERVDGDGFQHQIGQASGAETVDAGAG